MLAAGRFNIVKKFLIALAAIGASLTAARAADLEFRPPPPAPPPVSNWSGPYVGLGLSTRYNSVDGSVTSATAGTTPIPLPPVTDGGTGWEFWRTGGPSGMAYVDSIALRGGFYAGWNWQVSPRYVVGVEADFALANETASIHGSPYLTSLQFGTPSTPFGASPNDGFTVRTTWDSSARLRFGWLVTPSIMLYLTGGLAWAHIQVTSTCSTVPTPNVSNCAVGNYFGGTLGPDIITHSGTKLGWTLGTGLDVMLTPQWVIRGQYRFADFGYPNGGSGAFNFTDVRACTGCPAANNPLTVSSQVLLMQHMFEIGLAYKFGP